MNGNITLIIPAYNRAHTIGETLRSVADQRVMPAHIILVDNNSDDDTLKIMSDFAATHPQLKISVLSEKQRGACAARNHGLSEVTTRYVMFFDSDDVMSPEHIADFEHAITKHPEALIFGRSIVNVSANGKRRKLYFTSRKPLFSHLFRSCMSTQRIVVDTALLRRIGAWNTTLEAWNDYELGVRLILAVSPCQIIDIGGTPTVTTYTHADSITGLNYTSHHERWETALDTIEKIIDENIAIGQCRSEAHNWLAARRAILAAQYALEAKRNIADATLSRHYAEIMLAKALAGVDSKWKIKLIYRHNLIFHRLTWLLVKMVY